ncbi:MAG: hypothetical protein OEM59_08500 [Rhodospirillales bacterium]|nr:hypothetical protein [Rhodospirillales bacterium]
MKWYAIPTRYNLWFVIGLAGLAWAVIGGVYVYFAEPYLVFEERRISDEPETVRIRLVDNYQRSEEEKVFICPYVDEITEPSNVQTDERRSFLALAFPEGLTSPLETELAVKGNVFQLSGYRYQDHRKHILTGEIEIPPESFPQRFDVIAWEVVTPYAVVASEGGSSESAVSENRTAPVHHKMEISDTSSDLFKFPASLRCPARLTLWRAISIYSRGKKDE